VHPPHQPGIEVPREMIDEFRVSWHAFVLF
jgi:hypothetical protein